MVSCEFDAIVKHEKILSEWAEHFSSSNTLMIIAGLLLYILLRRGENPTAYSKKYCEHVC